MGEEEHEDKKDREGEGEERGGEEVAEGGTHAGVWVQTGVAAEEVDGELDSVLAQIARLKQQVASS